MLVAAKYEEIYPPTIADFVYISDGTYKKHEVLKMESVLLNTLGFALTVPTSWEFTKMFIRNSGGSVDALTSSLADVCHVISFLPSCLCHAI
jgi:cyclin A